MDNDVIMENETNSLISKTFFWMFLGLLSTSGVAWYTYASGLLENIIVSDYWSILLIVEFVVVILFSLLFRKLPSTVVTILYFLYAMLNGVSLSTIFVIFELDSIILIFVVSALLFGVFAFLGSISKIDFSKWYNLLFGTLLASLVVSIINLFLHNSALDIILDWIILFTFFGITAYDMNKIKQLQYDVNSDKLQIYGAMQLYLDFVNIFIRILSLLGKRKR